MGGSGGGGTTVVPFNMAALAPLMPSVFNGPYNAQGAYQNEQMLASKYPWITPPAGQFQGAQPGQYAGASNNSTDPLAALLGAFGGGNGGSFGFPGSGVPGAPPPNPPIPPTVPQGGGNMAGQYNPVGMAGGQTNPMMPNTLQSILAVLNAQSPPIGPTGK